MKNFNLICSLMVISILMNSNYLNSDDQVEYFNNESSSAWNGFMGNTRTGHSTESQVIPHQNPVMVKEWTKKIGTGYSGVSLIDNTAITYVFRS